MKARSCDGMKPKQNESHSKWRRPKKILHQQAQTQTGYYTKHHLFSAHQSCTNFSNGFMFLQIKSFLKRSQHTFVCFHRNLMKEIFQENFYIFFLFSFAVENLHFKYLQRTLIRELRGKIQFQFDYAISMSVFFYVLNFTWLSYTRVIAFIV